MSNHLFSYRPKQLCVISLIWLASAVSAQAGFFVNSSGISNPAKTINFDEVAVANSATLTTQYSSHGVTFVNVVYNPVPNESYPNITPPNIGNFRAGGSGTNPFSIRFNSPQQRAAFALTSQAGSTTFTALLNGSVVATAQSVPTGFASSTNFYGFENITFDEIQISVSSSDHACLIDRLQFDAVGQFNGSQTRWLGGTGLWPDGLKWSNGVPNSSGADVVVDGGAAANSLVKLETGSTTNGYGATVGRLTIDTGDRVELGALSSLTVASGGFTGAGELIVNGTLALPLSQNSLFGAKTIKGTGKVVLGGATERPDIRDLTVNLGTIEGTAQFGRADSYRAPVHNEGTIHANISGQSIEFHNQGGTAGGSNTGTLKASNGGTLHIGQGSWNGTGGNVIADGPGSRAWFRDGNLWEGGTISAINGGHNRVAGDGTFHTQGTWKNLTVQGPTDVQRGALVLDGIVTNHGVISPGQNGVIKLASTTEMVTLAGTGQVVLDHYDDPTFGNRGAGKLLIQDQTIRGRGNLGHVEMDFTNRGTIQADRSGSNLNFNLNSLDNQSGGVLRATDGGVLNLTMREHRGVPFGF
jgi:hypothetical protein